MDKYEAVRSLPLAGVLHALGFTEWKDRKSGLEKYGRCPSHAPKRNSNSFSFHKDGRYQCFSCGAKGRGSIDLVMLVKQVNFRDAVAFLEGISGAIHPETIDVSAQDEAPPISENPAFSGNYEKYYQPCDWLTERGLSDKTLKLFGVGLYENPKRVSIYAGKVMSPIRRWNDGEKVGYAARTIEPAEGEPKYLFPKGFQKHLELFGCCQLREQGVARPPRLHRGKSVCGHEVLAARSACGLAVRLVSFARASRYRRQLAKGWMYLPDKNKEEGVGKSVAMLSRFCWVKQPALPEGCDDPESLRLEQIRGLS